VKNWSIKRQILLLLLSIVTISVVSLTVLTVNQIRSQLEESLKLKAISIASVISRNIGHGIVTRDNAFVSEVVNAALADKDIHEISVYDTAYLEIYRSMPDPRPVALEDTCNFVEETEVSHIGQLFFVEQPITVRDRQVGYLCLVVSEESLRARIRQSVTIILAGAFLLLVLTVVVGVGVSRRVVKPIHTFEEAVTRISSGDIASSIELPILHRDFLQLGAAFNQMQDALREVFQQLRRSRDELENQVAAKTEEFQDELSERQRAEAALREKQELLRATLESTADGILVVNSEGQVTHANALFTEMWRIPEEVLATMDDDKLLAHVQDQLISPELFLAKVKELYNTTDKSLDTLHFKDGRVFERFSCPLVQDGEIAGRVWSFRDITERKRNEQAKSVLVHVSEAANQVDSLEQLLVIVQGHLGTLIDTNNFYVALYNDESGLYTFPYHRDEYDDLDSSPQALDGSLTDYVRRTGEPLLADEHTRRPLEELDELKMMGCPSAVWLGVPLRTSAGTIGVMAIQDYTNPSAYTGADADWLMSIADPIARVIERKQAEDQERELRDQLERVKRMESLGILAGGVAHDLNNMLGPLVGYPELMLMRLPEDSPLRKQVLRMGKSAREAAEVVQDLLTLARRGRYNMVPTDLNEIIEAYLDSPGFVKLDETHPEITVSTSLDRQTGKILSSAPHLSKVVMNLVVNAFDAMPEGGKLSITTSQCYLEKLIGGYEEINPGNFVLLSIRDTGMGIDAEDIDKIFEPYYSKKKMGISGSGLGLSVVYGVVKDHKGYYDILSTVGEGTEFILYFPVTEVAVEEELQSSSKPGGTESVLVVDDDSAQLKVTTALISSLGYQVDAVANGHEAVNYFKNGSVDIIVLDMIMEKDFDGLDTYREIIKYRPGQKAIIVSGFSFTDRVAEMQDLGAGAYVKKPYTRSIIARAIREELDRVSSPAMAQDQSEPARD